ncbi:hypothetical protein GGR28_000154 [Lewinella aquimaris]|uniref:Uncharacterized protein n=1 Tax=Neolewinella aquimaris TaxID=1835722 RepID=A0A840E0T3_9BACT|nr:hypothetical protein [Neolewinella aquimaris]MBB4077553.1 hypothetical protein [Neolewinella aquimaris]
MANAKFKLFSVLVCLLIISASCSGFLAGRTVRLQQEGKFDQLQQVSERVVSNATLIHRGVEVIKRVMLR